MRHGNEGSEQGKERRELAQLHNPSCQTLKNMLSQTTFEPIQHGWKIEKGVLRSELLVRKGRWMLNPIMRARMEGEV
jgi:hypothetical protein